VKNGETLVVALRALLYKLCKRWEFGPVVLLVITIYMEVLLEGLIYVFGLPITVGVIT